MPREFWSTGFGKWVADRKKYIFSIAGAIVIIATFVVKDYYREKLRSLADSIATAEGTFLVRSENERIYALLSEARHPIDMFTSARKNEGGSSGSFGWFDRKILESDYKEVQAAIVTLDNIARLKKKLPGPEGETNQAEKIKADIRVFNAKWAEYSALPIFQNIGEKGILISRSLRQIKTLWIRQ